MTRQIVLDTETTGFPWQKGHRIIEIGAYELMDRKATGKTFHQYLNPQRSIDEGAFSVHGISEDFLKDKPLFKEVASDFMTFIEGAELLIHNAPFDVGFLDYELSLLPGRLQTIESVSTVTDTLIMARDKHPGARNSLDALCKRYEVDNSNRELHGALLDAELLAFVYLAMTGGQVGLFAQEDGSQEHASMAGGDAAQITAWPLDTIHCSDEDKASHQNYLETMKNAGPCVWLEVS